MLHIKELTYRIEGRTIIDSATVAVPTGHRVGLVGRNGAGKTTLLRLLKGEIAPDDGSITTQRNANIGYVAQEAPGGDARLIDWVLAADEERAGLLAKAEHKTDPNRIAEIQVRLSDIDAHSAPTRAARILAGLGFDENEQQQACRQFSGGWRMRVALAAVLFLEPEILLLDEPTNYLDLEGTIWLDNYLAHYPHTVLIVSHDRDLLNKSVDSILHLEHGRLTLYSGGYDAFEETRRERQRLQLKQKKKQDDQRRHLQAFIDRFRAKATKAKQAQSRIKTLSKMQPIAAIVNDPTLPFRFPNPTRRVASPLLRLENVSTGYDPGRPVLRDLDLRLDHDDRIALLGKNGNGKSTFAKLLAGRLTAEEGQIIGANKIDVGYFAQHQLEDLNPNATPYDYFEQLMPHATQAARRTRLGSFGFSAIKADTRCGNLSGGEKTRLLLAMTSFHGPHLLILDEPTNHLDVDSREALIHALAEFEGAIILISHDRHLVETSADTLWRVHNQTVSIYDGDMDTYRAELLNSSSENKAQQEALTDNETTLSRTDIRRMAAEKRARLAPFKKAVSDAERKIAKLSEQIEKLDQLLANPDIYTAEPEKARTAAAEPSRLAQELGKQEQRWLESTDAYERAESELDAPTLCANRALEISTKNFFKCL